MKNTHSLKRDGVKILTKVFIKILTKILIKVLIKVLTNSERVMLNHVFRFVWIMIIVGRELIRPDEQKQSRRI